jgi:AcrR family transcriptional regulator
MQKRHAHTPTAAPAHDAAHRRGRPRDPARDARILDAAVALVAEVGYDRATVEAIAERAGVGKPTIYRRFTGKAEIVAAAIRARKGDEPPADTGSLRGDLRARVHALRTSLSAEDVQLAAGITRLLRSSDELAALFREHVVAVERARWSAILERAAARGELPGGAQDVTPLVGDIAPAIVFSRVMFSGDPLDDAFVDDLVDRVLLPAIRAGAAPPNA